MVEEKTLVIDTCDGEQRITLSKNHQNEDCINVICEEVNDAHCNFNLYLDEKEAEQLIDGIEYMFKLRKYANLKD